MNVEVSGPSHKVVRFPWWRRALIAAAVGAAVATALAIQRGRWEVTAGPFHLTVSQGIKPILVTLLLFVLGLLPAAGYAGFWRGVRGVTGSGPFKRICLALGSVVVFFSLFELGLKVAGFEAELPPMVIHGKVDQGDGSSRYLIPDRELRWKLNPGAEFNGRPVNSMGFFDREVDPEKRPGSLRVICMGDSCTGQGIPPYSGFLHEQLTNAPPTDAAWESFNMGVHGYSSVQGLRLFQLRGKQLGPDVVTLFFGWNDHWQGGRTDSNNMGLRGNPVTGWIYTQLRERRFFQFLIYKLNPHRKLVRVDKNIGLRVPQDEYVWTLGTFVEEIRSVGAVPILITAPRAPELTTMLVHNKQASDVEAVAALHDEYVELTRQVARETGTRLVDLAAEFDNPEGAALFSDDGIHFRREGRIRLAGMLYDELEDLAGEELRPAGRK